jgi:sugar transferase EpsL
VNTILSRNKNYTRDKRIFDLVVTFFLLVILSPLFLLIGFMVRIMIGTPVFFRQNRSGKDGKPFIINKFCTMTNERGKNGNLLTDADRLNPLGRFLRRTSMDELPELLNVIKGEMSLVGPRPLLMQYLDRYTPEQMCRHNVRPGITGWAQVNGRNAISWEEKFQLDVWYVKNQSFWLDLNILWLTVYRVLQRQGISQKGQATCQPFKGRKE